MRPAAGDVEHRLVMPVTRVMPSNGVHCDRARAQRAVTERFSASFSRSR